MSDINTGLLEAERKIHSARDNKLHLILDVMDVRFRPIKNILEARESVIEGYFKYPLDYDSDVKRSYLEMFIHCNKGLKDFLGI